jgi:serine/threonine protein kinase
VETAPGLTGAEQMLGTVDYVAPEQIEGSEPDARSDVYSLGCVLYEMLVGHAPFADQKGGMAKMWAQVNAEPASIRDKRLDVPQALEDVLQRAMSKSPDARPAAATFRECVLRAVGETP